MFNDPESVQYLFLYYLSEYVGGLWYMLWGGCGIFGFRLLAMFVITATAYIVYRMMRNYVPQWCIMAGMFWAFLCADYGMMVFYHDYLTALLAVGASYALFLSLQKDSPRLMALSGFIIGINVFVRLPNLSLVLLILLLAPYYRRNRNVLKVLRMLLYALSGFAVGVLSVLALMAISGHYDIFMQAIADGFLAVGDEKSTHNLTDMLMIYILNYKQVITDAVLITAFPVAILLLRSRIMPRIGWVVCNCGLGLRFVCYAFVVKYVYALRRVYGRVRIGIGAEKCRMGHEIPFAYNPCQHVCPAAWQRLWYWQYGRVLRLHVWTVRFGRDLQAVWHAAARQTGVAATAVVQRRLRTVCPEEGCPQYCEPVLLR